MTAAASTCSSATCAPGARVNAHAIELAAVAVLALGQLLIQLLALVLALVLTLAGYKPASKPYKAPQQAPVPIKATTTRKPRKARSRASLVVEAA